MVVLKHLFYISVIIVSCVLSPSVEGIKKKLQKTLIIYNRKPDAPVVMKHLERVNTASPFHIIIDLKVDPLTLNSLLMKYMESRSSYLWNSEELIPKYVESCTAINNVVGIYSDISYVRPLYQRKFFNKLWMPRAQFALWITGSVVPVVIQTVLENFWSLDCLNVEIIMTSALRGKVRRFIYNPFNLGRYDSGELIKVPKFHDFFRDKLTNLHGHKIAISVYHSEPSAIFANHGTLNGARGTVIKLLNYISWWMNFTIVLKTSPLPLSSYTQYLPQEKYDKVIIGPVGDIIKGRSEMLGNAQLLELASDLDLEFLYPLKNTEILMVVPFDKELSSISQIFRYVDPMSEILILISIAIFSLYIAIIHKRNLITTYFQLLLQKNIQSISNRMSERIFVFSWLVFAYIIGSAHESHIMQSLTGPIISPSITTLEDIAKSDLKIVLDYTQYKALKSTRNHLTDELIRRSEINPNYSDCLLRLGSGERVACFGSKTEIKNAINTLKKRMLKNRTKYHIEPHIIGTSKYSFSVTIVRKGFPYLKKFEKAYFNIYRYGLIHKWRTASHIASFKQSNEFDGPLKLIQFQGVFGLFAICIIITNIIFMGEIIFHYCTTSILS